MFLKRVVEGCVCMLVFFCRFSLWALLASSGAGKRVLWSRARWGRGAGGGGVSMFSGPSYEEFVWDKFCSSERFKVLGCDLGVGIRVLIVQVIKSAN